jgi:DNA sulfur modification protein DndD
MKIKKITIHNFRIYKGGNQIDFDNNANKNITVIAGRNGYGKTTLLTALVWVFYGRLMSQVEDKYKKEIKSTQGYENYLLSLFNNSVRRENEEGVSSDSTLFVEVDLSDLLIPSIPCKIVKIRRSFDLKTKEETLVLLIDGDENELTKEVGYEVFINDFILPREIAKFFFFDAEKIVSLAEAKSKPELRNLSKAYSEVLGIKKYEELKKNLESLLIRLRRRGVTEYENSRLEELLTSEEDLQDLINFNLHEQDEADKKNTLLRVKSDGLQEKLIREGNAITLDELKELKENRDNLRQVSKIIKGNLKKLLDLAPLVIAGKHLNRLHDQLGAENELLKGSLDSQSLKKEMKLFSENVMQKIDHLQLEPSTRKKIENSLKTASKERYNSEIVSFGKKEILLDFSEESFREFQAILNNIKTSYLEQFNRVVQEEKNNRILLSRTLRKIKEAEARKDNPLAKKIREEKADIENEIESLIQRKNNLIEEFGGLNQKLSSEKKIRSEYEKNFNLVTTDKKKFEVTETLLLKINKIIKNIKEDKKFSLQKAVFLGLKKLMHKDEFVTDVRVNIEEDVMDVDLIDSYGKVIDKEALSKGEQQLYASALLKALVDESGIKFPIFIDSPLQKFDKFHSENIIKDFYPSISEQVVLFPLLEKELSEKEYEYLKPNLSKAFLIENSVEGSKFKVIDTDYLFTEFKKEQSVYTY